jgi:hypothetical protein
MRRGRQTQRHHRQQALATREDPRVIAVLRKQNEHLVEALGSVVLEPWNLHEQGPKATTRDPLDSTTPESALPPEACAWMNVSLSNDRSEATDNPPTSSWSGPSIVGHIPSPTPVSADQIVMRVW